MDPEIVDIAGTKMLILLHLVLVMAAFAVGLFGGFCLGRYGKAKSSLQHVPPSRHGQRSIPLKTPA